MTVPSIALSIAQQIIDQPVQPLADPNEVDRATAAARMPTFFEQTFKALQDQEDQRNADQAAMQQQQAALEDQQRQADAAASVDTSFTPTSPEDTTAPTTDGAAPDTSAPPYYLAKPGVAIAPGTGPQGMIGPGNIDLTNRPIVHNPDGTYSTIRSITISDDTGKTYVIPTVVNGRIVSNDEAIKHWQDTGEHLGVFNNEPNANTFARALHEQQAARPDYQQFDQPSPNTAEQFLRSTYPAVEAAKTQPVANDATGSLLGHLKNVGEGLVENAKTALVAPHSFEDVKQRIGNLASTVHEALGLAPEAFLALPAKPFIEPIRRLTGYDGPIDEGGTLGEAIAKNPNSIDVPFTHGNVSIPEKMIGSFAAGAAVYAPLGIAAKSLGMGSGALDALFTGDALVSTKPYLDAYQKGEISGQDAIKGAITAMGPQLATLGVLHGISALRGASKEVKAATPEGSKIGTPLEFKESTVNQLRKDFSEFGNTDSHTIQKLSMVIGQARRSGTPDTEAEALAKSIGLDVLSVDGKIHNNIDGMTVYNPIHSDATPGSPIRIEELSPAVFKIDAEGNRKLVQPANVVLHDAVKPQSGAAEIVERPPTPSDVQVDRHTLTTPAGDRLEYRGTHINDVTVQDQGKGTGTALLNEAVARIQNSHPGAEITADLNSEGGAKLFAKQSGAEFTDRQGNPLTAEAAIASASKGEGPQVTLKPETPIPAGAAGAPRTDFLSGEPGTYVGWRTAKPGDLGKTDVFGGTYIAQNKDYANMFVGAEPDTVLHRVDVTVKKPFVLQNGNNAELLAAASEQAHTARGGTVKPGELAAYYREHGISHLDPAARDWLQRQGYDALISTHDAGAGLKSSTGPVMIALDPKSIKMMPETGDAGNVPSNVPVQIEPVAARGVSANAVTRINPITGEKEFFPYTAEQERATLNQFLVDHPSEGGHVPAQPPYLPTRDEQFASTLGQEPVPEQGLAMSSLRSNIEPVSEAITTGRRLGYRDEDIAAYLRRNYERGGVGYEFAIRQDPFRSTNPVADALGIKPRPVPKITTTPAAIAGGSKILPETPSIGTLEHALQSSASVNKVIQTVPQVRGVIRTVFGSSADTSTDAARMSAAHGELTIAYDNRTEVGMAHVQQTPMRDAFGVEKLSNDATTRQYSVDIKEKATGKTMRVPINDLLEENLNRFDLTKPQRDAILLRRQVWGEAIGQYNGMIARLQKSKFKIAGLKEAAEGLDNEQLFPRIVLGRVDAKGNLITTNALSSGRGSVAAKTVKTSASFKGSRASIDLYQLPNGEHVELPLGAKVVESQGKYQIMSKKDIAEFKANAAEGETLPTTVPLIRVHKLTASGDLVGLKNGESVYESPNGQRLNMTSEQARAYRKGLPYEERPTRLESNPYSRTLTTQEMQNTGVRYEDPDVTLSMKLGEIGRRTADLELLATTIERNQKLLRTKEQIIGNAKTGVHPIQPAEKFGGNEGDMINVKPFDSTKFPALKDYYGPEELVREIELRLGHQRTQLVPILSELGNAARGVVASSDVGTIGIQLMGSVANDLGNITRSALRVAKGDLPGAQRSLSNITGKAIMSKVHTAIEGDDFLPRILADPKNQGLLERWGAYLNPPHQSEFAGVNAQVGHGLAKLPLVGGGFRRLNQMFENALFMAQLEHARALEAIHGTNISAADREALGSWVRNSVGTLSSHRLGIAPLQQDIENTYLLFAARYTRSLFASAGALMKLDKGGTEARLALASLFGAGAAAYVGAANALGQKPEFNPLKPGFMAVRIGDNWVGVGGGVRSMAHLIANTGDTLFTHPADMLSPDFSGPRENPILAFWRSRSAPLAGVAMDIYTGEDFRGRPINWSTDLGSLLVSHGLPFAGQGAVEARGNFFTKAAMGLVTGTGYRSSPLSDYQLYDLYLKQQKNARTGEQRFPDGASTVQTSTNNFDEFRANDPQAAHLYQNVQDARSQGTSTQRDIQAVLDKRQAQLNAAETTFQKTHDYRTFRKQDAEIRAQSSDAFKQMALDSIGNTKDKQIVSSWYDTYHDPRAIDSVTGGISSDGLDQAQAEWKAANPGEWERVIEPSTLQGLTPTETQLRRDRSLIEKSGWWDTDKTAWQTLVDYTKQEGIDLPVTSSYKDYITARYNQLLGVATANNIPQPELWASTRLSADPIKSAFDRVRSRDRLILQSHNPRLTAALDRWSYNNTSKQEYGMAVANSEQDQSAP